MGLVHQLEGEKKWKIFRRVDCGIHPAINISPRVILLFILFLFLFSPSVNYVNKLIEIDQEEEG